MKEKGLGEVSAIRPGKEKESKKETEQNQHASSSHGGQSCRYKGRVKDVKGQWQM